MSDRFSESTKNDQQCCVFDEGTRRTTPDQSCAIVRYSVIIDLFLTDIITGPVARGQASSQTLTPNSTFQLLPSDYGWQPWVDDATLSITNTRHHYVGKVTFIASRE